jgi:hypothetical protein
MYEVKYDTMASVFQQELIRDGRGRLERIQLRYIDTARNRRKSELMKLKQLDAVLRIILKREFQRVLFRNQRANTAQVLRRVEGYLGAASTITNRYSRMQSMPANELTYQKIQEYLVETIQQSQEEANMTNLEWTYYISPLTYERGGAGKITTKYKLNIFKDSYQEYSDDDGPISCAAFALNYVMNYVKKRYKKRNIDYIKRDARALQTTLGWDQYVSMFEIQKFVELYPKYRVTILLTKENVFRDHTFEGKEYDHSVLQTTCVGAPDYTIYLAFDQQHYFAVYSPLAYFRAERNSRNYTFCHTCVELLLHKNHDCENWMLNAKDENIKPIRTCEFCGQKYTGTCSCPMIKCRNCEAGLDKDDSHRCILLPKETTKEFYMGGVQDGKKVALWVYDIESRIHITKETLTMQQIAEFDTDDEDYFTGDVNLYDFDAREHKANLIVLKNVFTGEMKQWSGDDCLQKMIDFIISYNRGNNICYAHNASGYDTRLIFDVATKMETKTQKPIMRGCKFIKFSIGQTHFHDTLLHLQGSLRGLAKEYCSHVQLEKGYFPHLFNSVENYNYVGPIPDIEFFDLSFTIKDDKEFESFMSWYDSWANRTDWCFQQELEKYCINDVVVLCEVMKAHHEILVDKFGMSPWLKTTAPGYVHDVYLSQIVNTLELPDRKEDTQAYLERINYLAHNEYWAVLCPEEYNFARKALRGGRTEIRKIYHCVSDEEWAQGIRIRYQDICSQYPYQQAVHDFPVGTPTIYIWDEKFKLRKTTFYNATTKRSKLNVVYDAPIPTKEQLLTDEWFGIVCCTIEPPKDLYHPVLVHYDEKLGKSIASCNKIKEGVFTSIEFQKALEIGYQLITIHRFDKYVKKPSLWADVIKDLFIEKMVNSGPLPSQENQQRLKRQYDEAFGMGDDLQKTFDENRWIKNPAKKKTFKIMLNSGWGKHAQRLNLTSQKIIHRFNDHEEKLVLFENFSKNVLQLKSIIPLSTSQDLYNFDQGTLEPDYHSTYLPAGLFVPAYGRLHLWEQLNKLGKRVLMNDTDSIVYLYDPSKYNIPEGDMWGEWEVEDVDKQNGGIREFVGIGPKTYSIKCFNGETQTKCKGLSLKRGTDDLVNHETMKSLIVQDGVLQIEDKKIKVPQQTFVYKVGKGIRTHKMLKVLSFNPNDLKGELDEEGYLYPFGHE